MINEKLEKKNSLQLGGVKLFTVSVRALSISLELNNFRSQPRNSEQHLDVPPEVVPDLNTDN